MTGCAHVEAGYCPDCDRRRAELGAYLGALGIERFRANHALSALRADLQRVIPEARDVGLTVEEIAELVGMSRAAIYSLMNNGGNNDQ